MRAVLWRLGNLVGLLRLPSTNTHLEVLTLCTGRRSLKHATKDDGSLGLGLPLGKVQAQRST